MSKMDPEVKAIWLKALRTGHYNQVEGSLRKTQGRDRANETCEYGFCCLGVLTNEFMKSAAGRDYEWDAGYMSGSDGGLSTLVKDWAKLPMFVEGFLIEMNDEKQRDFDYIANWIELNL